MTIARRAVDLGYPLEASVQSYLPICDEVVIGYDPNCEDGTSDLVADLARREPAVRPIACSWDPDRRVGGVEIARQSQRAIDAADGDWVLYVQADEAIHEGDHAAIIAALSEPGACAALFDRRMFVDSLDREIPQFRRCDLLRLFRRASARVVGDAITCELLDGERRDVLDRGWRMFDYGRVGPAVEVLHRKHAVQELYHEQEHEIALRMRGEYWRSARRFDPAAHPAPIRASPTAHRPPGAVTLAVLLGPGEHEYVESFANQFDLWPGDVVVIDDSGGDGGCDLLSESLLRALSGERDRLTVRRRPPGSSAAAARNLAHELARAEWVLHADLDEAWDPVLLGRLRGLVGELRGAGATVCGLPRANLLDGVLANDIPVADRTEPGLERAGRDRSPWPPLHRDVQYRLVARDERWVGEIHERPAAVELAPQRAIRLDHTWIVHAKTLERQRRQDRHYRELGQTTGLIALAQRPSLPDAGQRLQPGRREHRQRRLPDLARFVPDAEPLAVPGERAFRFLFAGGSGPADGGDTALICYAAAFRHDDDVCLAIYDIAPDRVPAARTLGAQARRLREDPHGPEIVCLTPESPPARPAGLYTACDCLLAPFRGVDDGIIAEAMACGLPVLVPDRGDWLDYCDGSTAFFAAAPNTVDTGALIALMHHVVAHPAAARAVGSRAAAALRRAGGGTVALRPGLSACIVGGGPQTDLGPGIESVSGLAEQVVVVVARDGDDAAAPARERGVEVYELDAPGDVATVRNTAIDHALHRWVLVLEAGERLSDRSQHELRALVAGDGMVGYALRTSAPGDPDLRLFPNHPDLRYASGEATARLLPRDPGIGFVVERCGAVIER